MQYRDAEGKLSEREVRVIRTYTSRYETSYLEAHCLLAGARRTFRLDRIISVEVIAPAQSEEQLPRPAYAVQPEIRRAAQPAAPKRDERRLQREPGVSSGGIIYAVVAVLALFVVIIAVGSHSDSTSAGLMATIQTAARSAASPPYTGPINAVARPATSGNRIAVGEVAYRGYEVIAERTGTVTVYRVPTLAIGTATLREAYLSVNARLFEDRTGIHDLRLEAIYAAADTDGNGHLSWGEIVEFQKVIYRVFRYKSNDTALRPDQFLDQRGGDCEDWALFTAGLLHYWGWNAYVATFDPPEGGTGHAVAFVRVQEAIPGIGSYTIPASYAARGLAPGIYVPIDYNDVGGLTDAVGPGWLLDELYDPESLYGRAM
ncbi:MAG TPA: WYL domain-containing protein [Spirochaetia bacterium]|nr:WYL domain-containing protein [Spirochaetia bacterium]